MFGIKVYLNYFLWKIGMRDILPASIINSKRIAENNDPLVELDPHEFVIDLSYWRNGKCFVRKKVEKMLKTVQSSLPKGLKLCILCGYRSLEQQEKEWLREIKKQRQLHPDLPDFKIELLARGIVANPTKGFGPHQTGGAVDVTLVNAEKQQLDMGGKYVGKNHKTFAKNITDKQKQNRRALYDAMTWAGFANYPNEWWHYSFGDRGWAAYKSERVAVYGQVAI